MKKIIAIIALFVLSAGAAYSATAVGTTWQLPSGTAGFSFGVNNTITFKPSANVAMAYDGTTTTYSMGTYHQSGNKEFATSSVETQIFYHDLKASPGTAAIATVDGVDIVAAANIVPGAYAANWTASK